MKLLDKIKGTLEGVDSWSDLFDRLEYVPRSPIVLYGLYDAIWPTLGVEGNGWICLQCGKNDGEFSTAEVARSGGEIHGGVYHPGLALQFVEVDPKDAK